MDKGLSGFPALIRNYDEDEDRYNDAPLTRGGLSVIYLVIYHFWYFYFLLIIFIRFFSIELAIFIYWIDQVSGLLISIYMKSIFVFIFSFLATNLLITTLWIVFFKCRFP